MQEKLRVAVITGGPSSEHDVSLSTGSMVLQYLDPNRYVASKIHIYKNGQWQFLPQRKWYTTLAALRVVKRKFDVAFLALHGKFGEDGSLQAMLARHKIPFTGSGSRASKQAMNKVACERAFRKAGLLVPRSRLLTKNQAFPKKIDLPLVVKPVRGGSSIGISIVRSYRQLPSAIQAAFIEDYQVILQQYISGRELTCSILEKHGKPFALTPTEIIPRVSKFFDYRAKYQKGGSLEITPPQLSKTWIHKIQAAALTAHQVLGCRGMSRTDFMLLGKKLYILELNTIPGMTPTSLLPQAAKHDGYSFSKMLDLIIAASL